MSIHDTKKLRSHHWFGGRGKDGFIHRSWMKNRGYPDDMFDGRPVIGICNTFSDFTPCNAHFRELAEHIKYGVLDAGGFPLEFPVTSLGESNLRPTSMLLRNLVSMDVEESIRANPIDGVVLMCGCDKTSPSLIMGAASCDIPAIVLSGGPMLNGKFRGQDIGSGTDVWKFSEELRAGRMTEEEFCEAEAGMSRSEGACMTMGTASTLACMVESLGLALPYNAAYPAVDARRKVLARMTGRRIVELVKQDIRISHILTRKAFENAIMVNGAVGGSTNAVVHMLAIAGRVGVDITLDDWDRLGQTIPCLVNLMPSGKYLMEDFCYAGGLPAVMKELGDRLHTDALTVNGKTLGENVSNAPCWNRDVIFPAGAPFKDEGGIMVLRGNLSPRGAIIKPSAASPELMWHKGRAVVFKDIEDYKNRIDDPDLDIDENCIMVLQNCGPKGYPGMAEVGNMGLPPKLLQKGVSDMIRISDARMSGTAFGTVILHTAPEAAAGGPLGLVHEGDMIELDVHKRLLTLHVSDEELEKRRQAWNPPRHAMKGGYQSMYVEHVLQADQGVDFDFLVGCRGAAVPRESH